MRYILNSAVIPNPGIYHYNYISIEEAIEWLHRGEFKSFVSYPETAEYLKSISGLEIPINRDSTTMEEGDEALVCRLKYRVPDPNTKGQPQNPLNWELGILRRMR